MRKLSIRKQKVEIKNHDSNRTRHPLAFFLPRDGFIVRHRSDLLRFAPRTQNVEEAQAIRNATAKKACSQKEGMSEEAKELRDAAIVSILTLACIRCFFDSMMETLRLVGL
jgi:hypothetical protein